MGQSCSRIGAGKGFIIVRVGIVVAFASNRERDGQGPRGARAWLT
jgi:hypothetical protein